MRAWFVHWQSLSRISWEREKGDFFIYWNHENWRCNNFCWPPQFFNNHVLNISNFYARLPWGGRARRFIRGVFRFVVQYYHIKVHLFYEAYVQVSTTHVAPGSQITLYQYVPCFCLSIIKNSMGKPQGRHWGWWVWFLIYGDMVSYTGKPPGCIGA